MDGSHRVLGRSTHVSLRHPGIAWSTRGGVRAAQDNRCRASTSTMAVWLKVGTGVGNFKLRPRLAQIEKCTEHS